ncbi:serine-rich adhesin for platelets-like [Palaemon carinicauda]|uniref:serine-rich adhesin for platelets-like n=1 Tax=Palaemon carinicauda TaxID=392227 RepID=UPI0035B63113
MDYKEDEGQRYRESEELWKCPYDESHLILPLKFSAHLVKCRKNHPQINLERCFYNSNHYVKKSKMRQHLRECEDKANYDKLYPESSFDPPLSNFGASATPYESEAVWEDDWYPEETQKLDQARGVQSPSAQYKLFSDSSTTTSNTTSPGLSSPLGLESRVDADWYSVNDQTSYSIGENLETSTPLSHRKSDSLITQTSFDFSPHSSSMGGVHAQSPGNFSLYSPRSQPLRSSSNIPMQLGQQSSFQIKTTHFATTPIGSISDTFRIHGSQSVTADESNYSPKSDSKQVQGTGETSAASSATGKGSGTTSSDKNTRYLTPAEKKVIIKEKRFLEKKIVGIEKLEKKRASGKKLTEEEISKVGKRYHFERELEKLLAGVNLDG